MGPPPAATATPEGRLRGASTQPSRRGEATRLRRTLRIVPPRGQRGRGATDHRARNRGRTLNIISISLVVAALLAVVVAQALLANGQVHLSALQHQLSLEQSAHRQTELSVSELETPARIVGAATSELKMVRPATVIELHYVSLNTPLATPNVTPPPAPPSASTASAGASTTSTASAGTSSTTATSTP